MRFFEGRRGFLFLLFSRTFFHPSTAPGTPASYSAATGGPDAARLRPAGPTGVCEEFVQSRTTRLSVQRQLEERGCKRTLRSNSDEAAPPENPGCLSSWAERRWRGRGTGARKLAEEGGGFGVPAAANLKPKNDQAAPLPLSRSG